ncbi:MAG: hypothetical protein GY953_24520 [bacterium]|nr:hypothetical protein [bacterium]
MKRALGAAWWALPIGFCFTFYWQGLWIWFYQDDFAWLNLSLRLDQGHGLGALLFAPEAQGTIRPWSERGFFLLFHHLFGLDAFPFRVWIYLTVGADLLLLASIARRLTSSRLAGFLAPVLWASNIGVASTLSWISAYNQILCGFFLLAAFHLFLQHTETSQWRYYVAQWAVFLLGFGALELNVVYPALVAAYALCLARPYLLRTLPMFVASAGYVWLHLAAAPKEGAGPYAMHFDAALPGTLWKYYLLAFGGERISQITSEPIWGILGSVIAWVLCLSLLAFLGFQLWRRAWLAGFCLLWFCGLIAPVVPLRDHVSDYYLTLPAIGLAMAGAWAVGAAQKASWSWAATAFTCAGLYLAVSAPLGHAITTWSLHRSLDARNLVLGVGRAQQLHPGKIILLDGVSSDLFWSGVADKPFPLVGPAEVFLTSDSDQSIAAHPELAEISDYILPPGPMLRALGEDKAVVYRSATGPLRNVTQAFREIAPTRWRPGASRRVDVGQPLVADQLGEGWYPIEGSHRWMARQASVRLGGPRTTAEKLYVTGHCSRAQVEEGPVRLSIEVDGHALAAVMLSQPDAPFDFQFELPSNLVGKSNIQIDLAVDRTFSPPGDGRALGAAFGVFSIR